MKQFILLILLGVSAEALTIREIPPFRLQSHLTETIGDTLGQMAKDSLCTPQRTSFLRDALHTLCGGRVISDDYKSLVILKALTAGSLLDCSPNPHLKDTILSAAREAERSFAHTSLGARIRAYAAAETGELVRARRIYDSLHRAGALHSSREYLDYQKILKNLYIPDLPREVNITRADALLTEPAEYEATAAYWEIRDLPASRHPQYTYRRVYLLTPQYPFAFSLPDTGEHRLYSPPDSLLPTQAKRPRWRPTALKEQSELTITLDGAAQETSLPAYIYPRITGRFSRVSREYESRNLLMLNCSYGRMRYTYILFDYPLGRNRGSSHAPNRTVRYTLRLKSTHSTAAKAEALLQIFLQRFPGVYRALSADTLL
ncbi:MAG: hypothetical protein ACQEQV_03820 [Fibrobacterota bacterium]